MNCKPNDLAIVVKSQYPHLLGHVIRVKHFMTLDNGTAEGILVWAYEGDLINTAGQRVAYAEDVCLKPIRDPGDKAVDEMVNLTRNKKETVKA